MKRIYLLLLMLILTISTFAQTTPWSSSPTVTPQTRSLSGAKQIRWLWGTSNLYSLDDSLAKYLQKKDSIANNGYVTHDYFNSHLPAALTFSNGLTRTVNDVAFGGSLTGDTFLNIGSNELRMYSTGVTFDMYPFGKALTLTADDIPGIYRGLVEANTGVATMRSFPTLSAGNQQFSIGPVSGTPIMLVTDDASHKGIEGSEDFSANLNSLSYPQKIYVDGKSSSDSTTNSGLYVALNPISSQTINQGNSSFFLSGANTDYSYNFLNYFSSGIPSGIWGVSSNADGRGSSLNLYVDHFDLGHSNASGGQFNINSSGESIYNSIDSTGVKYLDSASFSKATSLTLMPKGYIDNAISSSALTFDGGLTRTINNIQIGGSLLHDATINTNGNAFNIQNTNGSVALSVDDNSKSVSLNAGNTNGSIDGSFGEFYSDANGISFIRDTRVSGVNLNQSLHFDATNMVIVDELNHKGLIGGDYFGNSLDTNAYAQQGYVNKKLDSIVTALTPIGGFASKDSSLQVNKNLYELSDKAVSRTNLGVYSKTETDANYIQNIGTLQTGALFNVSKATITGATPASVSTSSGTNAPTSFVFTPALGGSTSNSGSFAVGGNASNLAITMGKGGSITGTPTTGVAGNGGDINLLAGDAGDVAGTTKIGGEAGEFIAQGGLSSNVDGGSGGNTSIKGGNGETSHNTTGGSVYLVAGQGHGTGLDGSIFLNVSTAPTVRGNTVIANTVDDRLHRLQVTGSFIASDTGIMARIKLNGTGGNGLIDYTAQSSTPTTPSANHQISYADASGRFTLMGSNGFAASISKSLLTASRVYNLPDSAGILALENRIIPNSNLANSTISGISLGSNLSNLVAGTGLTGSNYNGSATQTWANNLSTGVSGGQSVIGGTASGNNLTLSSTSHATKGKILFGNSAYDEVNNLLGIGTNSPNSALNVENDALGATAPTVSQGVNIQNITPATVSVNQNSPSLTLTGFGWGTTAGSSQSVQFKQYISTAQSTTALGTLNFANSINGAAFTIPLTLTQSGVLTAGSTFICNNSTTSSNAFTSSATTANANFTTTTQGVTNVTTAKYLWGGASSTTYRTAIGSGASSGTLTASSNYGGVIIASAPITAATSGTNTWAANLAVMPIGSYTSGTGTVTNSATLYIDGAASFATNNYALYVAAGNVNIQALSASSAIATDGSKNLISVTNTGTGNNVLATSPTLITPKLTGYTVATLPAGTIGMIAYVTDALTPAALTLVVGGGAQVVPVFYNGTQWIVQ